MKTRHFFSNFLRISLLIIVFLYGSIDTLAADSKQAMELFEYSDLGFSMEIPAGWEGLSNTQVKQRMAELTEKSEGKDVSGAMDQTDVFLSIKGDPVSKEEGAVRPSITCSAMSLGEVKGDLQKQAAHYGLIQSRIRYAANPNNSVSEIGSVKLEGADAESFTVKIGDTGLGIMILGFAHRDHAIVCGGGYDTGNMAIIEESFMSIKVK